MEIRESGGRNEQNRALGGGGGGMKKTGENRNRVPGSVTLALNEKAPCCFAQLPASCQVAKEPAKGTGLESATQQSVCSAINKG